ncbi:ATP-binding response regulator [Rubinisphaera margarita]|uniref:ATP-binding response regulator n=1 Tax=Rubinisphaera margarita TaxID=2909586 RepID=UPI001EE97E4C|nr:ATP-binding protein [Rubinisphaera margarita]MCG6154457.1 ATP-binding protein [Rubinisphaera margarita]
MRILIVDAVRRFQELARAVVNHVFATIDVDAADGLATARPLLKQRHYELVVVDASQLDSGSQDLLAHMNLWYEATPVVILSATGLEERVLDAIRRGAIGFVRKEHFKEELPQQIRSILNATMRSQPNSLAGSLLKEQTTSFCLPNERTLIVKVNNYCAQLLQVFQICPQRDQMRILLALEEALTNAMNHGNLEVSSDLRGVDDEAYLRLLQERSNIPRFANRRVEMDITVTTSLARFRIRDEGPGFDVSRLPDPCDPANIGRSHGRGVFLMRTYMDEVQYNDLGNEVTMIKYKSDQQGGSTDSAIWTHVQSPEILQLREEMNS